MLKYTEFQVTFSEVPDEVTLCINISNCPIRCPDCHSKHLWEDIGTELTTEELSNLIESNKGISCVVLMGGDNDVYEICKLAEHIKLTTTLKVCWYSGNSLNNDLPLEFFDYLKTGPYKGELGGLNSAITNQRFYRVMAKTDIKGTLIYRYLDDITYKFQRSKYEANNKSKSVD